MGLGISASFFITGFSDAPTALFVVGAIIGLTMLGIANVPKPIVASLSVIWISTVAAVYFADMTVAAMWAALWFTFMVAIAVTRVTTNVLWWLLPAATIQAAAIWHGSIMVGAARQIGLMNNPNTASGLMALAAVLLLTHRRTQWFAIPFLAAIPMTGSRAATAAMAVMLVLLLLKRVVATRKWAAIVAVTVLITIPFWETMAPGLRIVSAPDGPATQPQGIAIESAVADTATRIQVTQAPSAIPTGPAGVKSDQHNQLLRMAEEIGIGGAIAWAALLAWALWKRRYTPAWYMLATAAMLTVFDFYFWMPAGLTVLWWLMINLQTQRKVTE